MKRYDDPTLRDQALEVLSTSDVPVSIDYVRHHLSVCWQTARAVLFNLVLEGKIRGTKTTAGWFFSADQEKGQNRKRNS